MARSNTGIPGLSFSLRRALGITNLRRKVASKTGVPTSRSGIERRIGKGLLKSIFG